MTASDTPPPTSQELAPRPRHSWVNKLAWSGFLVLFIAASGTLIAYAPLNTERLSPVATAPVVDPHNAETSQLTYVQNQLVRLTQRLDTLEQATASAPEATSETANAIAALTQDVRKVQTQALKAAEPAQQAHHQESAALVIALQALAAEGQAFPDALALALRLTPEDSALHAQLKELVPVAATGAPALSTLTAQLETLAPRLEQNLRRAEATTWIERIQTELRNLIVIKQAGVASTTETQLTAIAQQLRAGHTAEALAQSKNLPASVQPLLQDWQDVLATRVKLDEAFAASLNAIHPAQGSL